MKKKEIGAKAGSKAQKKRTQEGEEGDEELSEEEAEAAAQAKRPDAKTEEAEKKKAEEQKRKYEEKAAAEEKKKGDKGDDKDAGGDVPSDEGLYIVGDEKPGQTAPRPESATRVLAPASAARLQGAALLRQAAAVDDSDKKPGGVAGAYAPRGTAAPASPTPSASTVPSGPRGKDGKPLSLRFVLPAGAGAESLRAVGERISRMLDRIGVGTEISKVSDDEYFKDHIASGQYDLALYSWPASAFPATDGRPIYAKPVPASDGSLLVEQNYTRVGTDHIDQLFASAAAELNEGKSRDLVRQADARIWAAAGSIPSTSVRSWSR